MSRSLKIRLAESLVIADISLISHSPANYKATFLSILFCCMVVLRLLKSDQGRVLIECVLGKLIYTNS